MRNFFSKSLKVLLLGLLSGSALAADVRLGLNSSASLGCQIAAGRVGMQQGRWGGLLQGAYCSSNVQGQRGGAALGGALTFDLYQNFTGSLAAYALAGANTNPVGEPSIFGGLGLRYGLPLTPVELYIEGGVQRTQTILQPLVAPRFAIGVSYIMRAVDLQASEWNKSRPSDISALGASGLNVDKSAGGKVEPVPSNCNNSTDQDEANAVAVAERAAREALAAAAAAYSAMYSNVTYNVSVGGANIQGSRARVSGNVTLKATNRANGQEVGGSYRGFVNLVRSGCGWQAVGYSREDE